MPVKNSLLISKGFHKNFHTGSIIRNDQQKMCLHKATNIEKNLKYNDKSAGYSVSKKRQANRPNIILSAKFQTSKRKRRHLSQAIFK
jgi:hypothetical protein